MEHFLSVYFLQTGLGWTVIGAIAAVMFGGIGSAQGIRIAAGQAGGVLSEKPDLFGKLLVLIALPGTQGFYGFICAVMISTQIGLVGGELVTVPPIIGIGLLATGICVGAVLWRSAIYQGESSAAAISLVARQPDQAGRAILLPALVETYAVVALLAGILLTIWLTTKGLAFANPEVLVK